MRCNSTIHVIKDESLGGVMREYVEVDRKAKVGDFVYYHSDGRIAKVLSDEIADKEGLNSAVETYLSTALSFKAPVLEPTDIVNIAGERFRLVDRKAEVGERVIVTSAREPDVDFDVGDILIITKRYDYGGNRKGVFAEDTVVGVRDSEYRVLVPVESEITAADPPQSQEDIIANLVRRVSQLESELTGAKRDIETWAQEVEGLRYTNTELYSRLGYVEQDTDDLDEKVEMCIDDIVTLDERTNLSQEITINVAEFVKLIGGARR